MEQRGVIFARISQKRPAIGGVTRQRGVEDFGDVTPAFCIHIRLDAPRPHTSILGFCGVAIISLESGDVKRRVALRRAQRRMSMPARTAGVRAARVRSGTPEPMCRGTGCCWKEERSTCSL